MWEMPTLLQVAISLVDVKKGKPMDDPVMTNADTASSYLSVIIAARNSYKLTHECLIAAKYTFEDWQDVEFVLIDDNSDAESQIVPLFLQFRDALPSHSIKITSFKERQHYSRVLSYGLTQATGQLVFFLSNDMMITPDYIDKVLHVSGLSDDIGIVRGTSEYTEALPQYCYTPPLPLRDYQDILNFSSYVATYYGDAYAIDEILTGDAMLIKREVLNQVGYVDTQFFGYFGDVDYGLRVRRSGFKLACAQGAWLHHEGAGYIKHEALSKEYDLVYEERMKVVKAAYAKFRQKWNPSLPDEFPFKNDQLQNLSNQVSNQVMEVENYYPAPVFPSEILTRL